MIDLGKWERVIDPIALSTALNQVKAASKTYSIMPEYGNILKAFTMCPYDELKVVFIGQDPYPQKGKATGLAFANNSKPISKSLDVLTMSCLNDSVPHGPVEFDYTLESWARQGVLLLNSALTVIENMAGSHALIWSSFISSLLKNLSNRESGIIYVFLGKQAQMYIKNVNAETNYVLKDYHPAYYARKGQLMPNIFRTINTILKDQYNQKIEWYHEY